MKTLFLAIIALLYLGQSASFAHPGIGIVLDSKGNVFYTDLKHVWRITPDGKRSIVVRNVHTHELYIDPQDNLFGEHLWYEGERTDKWGHRVWRLSSDGKLTDLIPARQGFLDDYDDFHFVHDGTGTAYWVHRGDTTAIKKRSPEGKVTTIATARFQNVRWMTVTPQGIVYLVDLHDLVRVAPDGTVRTIVRNLAENRRSFLLTTDIHAIMGLWTDSQGSVYAAVFSDRAVKKVKGDGKVEVFARSPFGWKPTSGVTASNGDTYILECSTTNAVRVRCIRSNGTVAVFD